MKNRRLLFVLAFVIFVALGAVACIMILNVPREEHLATIELPSGDRIIIKFCYRDFLSASIRQGGGGSLFARFVCFRFDFVLETGNST